MDSVAAAAIAATALSAFQLIPQLIRSVRLRSTAGLSASWAAIGLILNLGWVAYRSSQQLWVSLPSPIIATCLYLALLVLVLRDGSPRYAVAAGALATIAALAGAHLFGGWLVVGSVLGIGGGVQVAPAVWSAYRSTGTAIAPGLWFAGLGQAVLWGFFGVANGDTAFVLYGVAMGAGSLAILLRCAAGRRPLVKRRRMSPQRIVTRLAAAALRR